MATSKQHTMHHKPVFIKDALLTLSVPVSILGTIVDLAVPSVSSRPLRLVLDDGTGQLPVVHFRSSLELNVGDDVFVRGTVQEFRDELQLKAGEMRRVEDPNMTTVWTNLVVHNYLLESNR